MHRFGPVRRRALVAVAGAGLVMAGWFTAAGAVSVPAACSLLDPSQIQSALSGTVGAGELTTRRGGGESICQWIVTKSNGGGYSAQLDVKSPFSAKMFGQQRRVAAGPTKTVKHLGDGAFSERVKLGGQVFDDLWVRRGTTAFRLEVLKDLGSGPLVQLAQTVLSRLAG